MEQGEAVYFRHCLRCHGLGVISGGLMPDLRFVSRDVHENFQAIVLGGAYKDRGMASFADVLDSDDTTAVHAYIVHRTRTSQGLPQRALRWMVSQFCLPASLVSD